MDRQAMSIYQPDYQTPTGSPIQVITSGNCFYIDPVRG